MKYLIFTLIILLFSPISANAKKIELPKFEFLNEGVDFKENCGCIFKTSDGKYLGFAEPTAENDPPILIKQSDKLLKIRCTKTTESKLQRYSPKIGDQFIRTYKDHSYSLELFFKITRVCDNDRTCESTDYDVTAKLTKDKKSVKLENIKGVCGC